MSHDCDVDRFTKPLKRVRFAEEVQEHVYHYQCDDEAESLHPAEVKQEELYTKESKDDKPEDQICDSITEVNELETNQLSDLLTETKLTTLSSLEVVIDSSSCKSEIKENDLKEEDSVDQNDCTTLLSHKRSSEGKQILRQTSILNKSLKDNIEINSAVDLKQAVYVAWSKLKTTENKKKLSPIPDAKKENDTSEEAFNDAFQKWKESKRIKKKKTREPECSPQIEDDLNEKIMAFQAWKKKKDDFLKRQIAEKSRKEETERLESLMNERVRKNNAESAYLAWMSHKTVVVKMEQKKKRWLLEKEKETHTEKTRRKEAAATIYYQWLRTKVYTLQKNPYKCIVDKPPWTPAGKANSLI